MTLSEYRNSSSWQGAIELGPKLMQLAEELPASETMGLSFQLRQAMVDVPATAAADALQNAGDGRMLPILKLLAALDTADARASVDRLAEGIVGKKFGQKDAGAAYLPGATTPASDEHPAAAPAAKPAAPSAVPVVPEASTPAAAPAPASTHIQVSPDGTVQAEGHNQESNVHTDSVQ